MIPARWRAALAAAILSAACCLFASGCASVGENNSGDLPWSAPAAWENQSLGVPIN